MSGVVMTPAEAIQHLTDNYRPEQPSQPVMVRRDLVYRIVADDGQSLSGGGLGHWQMSGSRKDPFNLLIKSQRYRGKNKPAIPLGRKVKLLYRAGTSDATHLAFAGEPVAEDVRQTFVLGKRARSVHLEGPLQQAAMMSIFKKTNTFQFSLVMSAMNLVLGLYTLRSQARDLPGIGWLKPVFLTSDNRR